MSTTNEKNAPAVLMALRKAVMLRDQYNTAMLALAEVLAGKDVDSVSGEHWAAMESSIDSLMGQAGSYSDIGYESVAMLQDDWNGVAL